MISSVPSVRLLAYVFSFRLLHPARGISNPKEVGTSVQVRAFTKDRCALSIPYEKASGSSKISGMHEERIFIISVHSMSAASSGDVITSGTVSAKLGSQITLQCYPSKKDTKVVQVQWTLCNQTKIGIYNELNGQHIEESFNERFCLPDEQSLQIHVVQKNDYRTYCCIISTFPHGTLRGNTSLMLDNNDKGPEVSLVKITVAVCGVLVLMGAFIGVLLYIRKQRRESMPDNISNVTRTQRNLQGTSLLVPSQSQTNRLVTGVQNPSQSQDNEEDQHHEYFNVMSYKDCHLA
ncbi:T-cell immunoreceptor with Ig and ITIM domains [Protopterus annectens]|uniref:T-cell immunoreceptor with Ig and ITIM domains n=1 Tax=Protopterus annectens TaxID=7888 RepID=UPI001CF94036|nr:T-cell immunoreceptor with Ig and ITIM domains [Protopterus annectens]